MINNIVLMGRLTANPELKTTPNGISCAAFSVAVERSVKSKDGERQTDFIPCVAWRNTAEFVCKYFVKGRMIAVAGELQTRKFTDKNGNNRTAFEVIAGNISFCGDSNGNGNAAAQPTQQPQGSSGDFMTIDVGDDLPF